METLSRYLRIWFASARYSLVRATMFRGDLFIWALVEFFWISVNVVMIGVIYSHTALVAGWNMYEMMILVGTSMLIQRFILAQPGDPLFMASTRKLELDGLINSFVAASLVVYSAAKLGLRPGVGDIALYAAMVACGVVIHFGALVIAMSLAFWITSSQGVEGSYFTLMEFSRLPKEAFHRGLVSVVFVWILPAVVVSNAPARVLLHGFQASWAAWLGAATLCWFALSVLVFRLGLRRYTSASS
jgi:ABC-2 type transport system permease protein